MKCPSKIKIGPRTYDIKYVEDLRSEDDKQIHGQCHPDELTISLHTGQKKNTEQDSVMHEVLHGIFNLIHLHMPDLEENIVCRMSPVLLGVIKENPKLVRYLVSES